MRSHRTESMIITPTGFKNVKFYGLQLDDFILYKSYFPTLRNGVFLEMGAFDGVYLSNTKFFEDFSGWSGVLIEPLANEYQKLIKNRPNCKCYNYAVSSQVGEIELYSNGEVSSVKDNTIDEFYDEYHKSKNAQIIKVPTKRLDTILHHAGVTRIDLWSLDIEGSEYEALETMDWSIPVYLIYMELQYPDKKERCHATLLANGFKMVQEYGINEVWINPANQRK